MENIENGFQNIINELNNCKNNQEKFKLMEEAERKAYKLIDSISHNRIYSSREELTNFFKKYPKYNAEIYVWQESSDRYVVSAFGVKLFTLEVLSRKVNSCGIDGYKAKIRETKTELQKDIDINKKYIDKYKKMIKMNYFQSVCHDLTAFEFLSPSTYRKAKDVLCDRLQELVELNFSKEMKLQTIETSSYRLLEKITVIQKYFKECFEEEDFRYIEDGHSEFFSVIESINMLNKQKIENRELPEFHFDESWVSKPTIKID